MAGQGPEPYVAVVGGVNMDIGGRPDGPLIERDSNPGRVRLSVGGVGFNIACNLALLGVRVVFLTALGRDGFAGRVTDACERAGIDLSRAAVSEEEPTSVYLYLEDERGDMRLAVSDMDVCRRITPAFLAERADVLDGAAAVVLDANIPGESVRHLAERCAAPLLADPVSVTKAEKLCPVLGRLDALKPNRIEAEALGGVPVRTEEDLGRAADALMASGLRRAFISLGGDGVLAAEGARRVRVPCCPARVRSLTGAGDAFMAGLVYSRLKGLDLEETARTASAAAAIAVEGAATVNPELSPETLAARMRLI